ncbi:hypothetical protein Trydic_g12382 [Trypoxylus dichotomus]
MSKPSVLVLFLIKYATALATQSLVDQGIHHAGSFRIFGGKIAPTATYPFMVSLRTYPNNHFCGGAIITNLWVLVAAHCLVGLSAANIFVVVGTNTLNFGGTAVRVRTMITQPSFNETAYLSNDFAMIQLDSPLIYSATIAPVTLDHIDPQSTVDVTMIGWETTRYCGSLSNNLRELYTKTLPQTLPTQSLVRRRINHGGSFRVMGGTIAENGAYPFMVSLRKLPGLYLCGGSILNILWILTAAHCVDGEIASGIIAVVGTNMLGSGGTIVQAQRIVLHPDFNNTGFKPNDIAMIRLTSALSYSSAVAPVTLGMEYQSTTYVTMIGWGSNSKRGPLSNRLQQFSTQILTQTECMRAWLNVTKKQICTKVELGRGACDGDSGGPLIDTSTKVQLGILSFSSHAACGVLPDVYTRISEYTLWMESTVNT